jgi:hypothetical protein
MYPLYTIQKIEIQTISQKLVSSQQTHNRQHTHQNKHTFQQALDSFHLYTYHQYTIRFCFLYYARSQTSESWSYPQDTVSCSYQLCIQISDLANKRAIVILVGTQEGLQRCGYFFIDAILILIGYVKNQ